MKTGRKRIFAALAALTLAFPAYAETMSLAELLGGESIVAGDKEFSGWELIFESATDPSLDLDLSNIMVTSLDDGGLDPGPGLSFDFGDEFTFAGVENCNPFAAPFCDTNFVDLTIGFFVDVLVDNLLIKDVSLETNGELTTDDTNEFNNLGWGVVETVYDNPFNDILADLFADVSLLDGFLFDFPDASGDFAGQSGVWVEVNIFAFAEQLSDLVSLDSMDLRFSQEVRDASVPEPGTLGLLGLGLIALGLSRRRRQR